MNPFDLIVIGGGAAGFFGAIQAATIKPGTQILILEKTGKLLTKVKVSGGGRCNVTHNCFDPIKLSHHYPRGEKKLKDLFKKFQAKDTLSWFAERGVDLKSEDDGRIFPVSNDSQTIIDCFLKEAIRKKIKIELNREVVNIIERNNAFTISCSDGTSFITKKILIATGGSAKESSYQWIKDLGHNIHPPIPSLFTFNDSVKPFADLMGLSVPDAEIKIAGTKFMQRGPLLITHWGISGPAVIKLSAWTAEYLHKINYEFTALVSWIGASSEEEIRTTLLDYKSNHPKQKVISNPLFHLPLRLWQRLVEIALISPEKTWGELPLKNLNKLLENLIRTPFLIKGKTTFKEEFVTCGGIDLQDINTETMESKKVKNIFFAGEVLNIDGETGGFNFQAAWTTAFIAASQLHSD